MVVKAKHSYHGQCDTRLYRIWTNVKHRVLPTAKKSKYYYERGITLCDEWAQNFISFRDWALANGYNDTLTLDRIDNNGNYEPSNCRWATMKEQSNNRSNNIRIYVHNKQVTFAQICDVLKLDYQTSYNKIMKHLIEVDGNT